ncbi:MAG TPA: uracil phosphoribosyltransferase [Pseudonocardiaceae bacterium]|jgi:uracil phosphoribosyltransferase|nr:uracil phosphoribosyltransferase [Pseudonocardiaceae bacterium]
MQRESYLQDLDARLHVHPSSEADALKAALLAVTDRPAVATTLLMRIGDILLRAIRATRAAAGNGPIQPVFVLRGGLPFWSLAQEFDDLQPSGLLVPARVRHSETPHVAYGSLPHPGNRGYLLLDMLIASGTTMAVCAQTVLDRTGVDGAALTFAAPFVAGSGRDALLQRFPQARIHCIWHAEEVDADGRMVGPGFDVGDFALGSAADRITWSDS